MLQTNEERVKVEDQLAEVELQHAGLQELIATLKDGRGAQKVADWHAKMETLRLEQLKHKRLIDRLKEQVPGHVMWRLGRSAVSRDGLVESCACGRCRHCRGHLGAPAQRGDPLPGQVITVT